MIKIEQSKRFIKDISKEISEISCSQDTFKTKAWRYRTILEWTFMFYFDLDENEYYKKNEYLQMINYDSRLFKKQIGTTFSVLYDFFGYWSHHKKSDLTEHELDKYFFKLLDLINQIYEVNIVVNREIKAPAILKEIIDADEKERESNMDLNTKKVDLNKPNLIKISDKSKIKNVGLIKTIWNVFVDSYNSSFDTIDKIRKNQEKRRERLSIDNIIKFQEMRRKRPFPQIESGMTVMHLRFGTGTVLEVKGVDPDKIAEVDFLNGGKKKLILRFARLIIIKKN